MNQFDIIYAVCKPVREDDLKPEARAFVGRVCKWQALWVIEEGPYEGDWAMSPMHSTAQFAWAPSRDLTELYCGYCDTRLEECQCNGRYV